MKKIALFALMTCACIAAAQISPFARTSYVQRGTLSERGRGELGITAMVSAKPGGEAALQLETSNAVMAKILLDENGNPKLAEGGPLFSECAVKKYVLPAFRAILMARDSYLEAELDAEGRPVKLICDGFEIRFGSYPKKAGPFPIPEFTAICGDEFSLVLRTVSAKRADFAGKAKERLKD